jgi:transglutaminase-like putative cysteine protease
LKESEGHVRCDAHPVDCDTAAGSHHPDIEALVARRGWRTLSPYDRIGAVYDFVRNEIAFGYNEGDELPASRVLADGIGQCNTKSTLLMALLRAVGIPCRFHGFTIDKPLQKGAITGLAYWLAPQRIIHSWVEVSLEGRWIALEGFILDAPYLASLQRRFPQARRFCGYGAATPDLSAPGVEWRGQDTYIQKEGIADDFGTFDSPMPSTRATAPTCRASSAGCTSESSATA